MIVVYCQVVWGMLADASSWISHFIVVIVLLQWKVLKCYCM